jgi:CBS domain-containing protein
MQQSLSGLKVDQVMERNFIRVPSLISLNQLVEERVLSGGERYFFVADNGRLDGMLTLRDIANIPQAKWRLTTLREVMVPNARLVRVAPQTELLAALRAMDDANVAQVPVLDGETLVGVLTREQVMHYLRTRAELGI